jgi:carbon monoxide dehydrogenase subunit G
VIRLDRRIDVERPANEVFERLTRIEELPRWQPAIVEAAVTSPGELRTGSTIRLVVDAGGRRTEALGRVTDLDSPERLAIEATAGPAALAALLTVEAAGEDRSVVGLQAEIRLGGMLRFVEGMVRGRIEAEAPEASASIKRWLESD